MCALLLAGCGPSRTPTASPSVAAAPESGGFAGPVRVTLGLYSGRADPAWTLTDAGGLGYHGFTIARPGATVVAYRGAVAPLGEGSRAYLADPALTIERLLIETARSLATGSELAEVERALAAP